MSRKYFGMPSVALAVLWLVLMPARAALITVTGTGDTIAVDGVATLREAITSINNQADVNADLTVNRVGGYASTPGGTPDVINFNIAGAGVKTISPLSAEPTIVRPVTINGYSQGVAAANTLANADNAVILIQLNGSGAGANADGLVLGAGSSGSTIKGLDITNFSSNGIVVQSNGNNILGNFLGVDPTGTTRMPNGTFPTSGNGILILNASNNQIGSTNPADRNITSGNALNGIRVVGTLAAPATGNIIQGNFVGVAADGKSSVGNRTEPAPAPGAAEGNNLFGIEISGGNLNTVGGAAAGARNVVGFNAAGIDVNNGGQTNSIQGNFVGVGADGVTPTGNLLEGIVLRSSNGFGAPLGPAQINEPGVSFNSIGGTVAGAGNLIEFNGTGGISIFGNPVSASLQPNVGNTILGNSVFQNGRRFATASSAPTPLLGIDLTNGFLFPREDGLTLNDSKGHGTPNAPNNFLNFPVLASVVSNGAQTTITGTLTQSVSPNTTFRIEFFANDLDPLGLPAEGQQFLGFVNTTTDPAGTASFSPTLGIAVALGRIVTATATDPLGNTSEFSAGVVVAPTLQSIAVTPANPSIPKGITQQFTATGTFSDNSTQNLTSQVTWASATTAVATISSGGLATGVAAGTSTISATLGGVSGSTVLTVTAPTLQSIAVTPANPSIPKGITQQFTATGTFSDNSTQNLTSQVTWASATTAVATISSGGLATGVAAGTSTISATLGAVSGSTVLTVTAPTLLSIAVTPANPSIPKGTTQQFTATGTFSDNSTQNLTSQVTWASATTAVATISSGGLATGVATGTSTISATLGAVSGSTALTVTAPTLLSIAVTPANPSILQGITQQFTATGTFSDNSTQNLTSQVTWTSAATSIATISSGGLATAVATGARTISATLGGLSGSTVLTVTALITSVASATGQPIPTLDYWAVLMLGFALLLLGRQSIRRSRLRRHLP